MRFISRRRRGKAGVPHAATALKEDNNMSFLRNFLDDIEFHACRNCETDQKNNAVMIGATAAAIVFVFFLLCGLLLFEKPDGFNNTPEYVKTMVKF